jgi:copper type II ascorbate-dependent monooxygenase-like protein
VNRAGPVCRLVFTSRINCFLVALSLVTPIVAAPTYYKDVAPILLTHCQSCHRNGQIAPFPLETFEQARKYAAAIAKVTHDRSMPPWFADPCCGHFANDPSLSRQEIATLAAWADDHAPAGNSKDTLPPKKWAQGWSIDEPDLVLSMPEAKRLPAHGDVPYQYIILPAHFREDRWVRMSEIRPGNRAVVHHAVAYIREPDSKWLRGAPVGKAFSADDLTDASERRDAMWTDSDILLVYAPGSSPDMWPENFAKLVPAGSDIVLQMHYAVHGANGPTADKTSIGLVFSKSPPVKRVLTLQLTNDKFEIPPGDPNYEVEVQGTIPNDALLLSFFPHMHLRGKTFQYNIVEPHGRIRTLLKVPDYNFYWQLSYRLQMPIPLKAGTRLQAQATFDNSARNTHNPDPSATVSWGEQTWAEMMVGFFDVAVDPAVDKKNFFERHR